MGGVGEVRMESYSEPAIGLPIYHREGDYLRIPIRVAPPLRAYNPVIYGAYTYYVNVFSAYLFARGIGFLVNYEPESGEAILITYREKVDGATLEESFKRDYYVPRLKQLLKNVSLEELLRVFYLTYDETSGGRYGATTLVLPAKKSILEELKRVDFKKLRLSGRLPPFNKSTIKDYMEEYEQKGDIVVIDKNGDIRVYTILDDGSLKEITESKGSRKQGMCVYCGRITDRTYKVSGRLGLGRMRLPFFKSTDVTTIDVCLDCILKAIFYVLSLNIDPSGTLPQILILGKRGVSVSTIIPLSRVKKLQDRRGRVKETKTSYNIRCLANMLSKISDEAGKALSYNEFLGDEKLFIRLGDAVDEKIMERLFFIFTVLGTSFLDKHLINPSPNDKIYSKIIETLIAEDDEAFLALLTSLLRSIQKSNLSVKYDMSYVSKYIESLLYRGRTEDHIAFALAKIASTILYYVDKELEGIAEKDRNYIKRRFAETLRRSGFVEAVAYILSRTGMKISTIVIPIQNGIEREMFKTFIDEVGLPPKYYEIDEEDSRVSIKATALNLIDIRVKEKFTPLIYEKVYNLLIIERQELVSKETSKGGEELA